MAELDLQLASAAPADQALSRAEELAYAKHDLAALVRVLEHG